LQCGRDKYGVELLQCCSHLLLLVVEIRFLFFRLAKSEDSKVELHKIPLLSELPPSFALLDIAHQWMGERGSSHTR